MQTQIIQGGKSFALDLLVDVSPTQMQVVASTMGMRLFTLIYDGTTTKQGIGMGLPFGIAEQQIINDIILMIASDDALIKSLPNGYTLMRLNETRKLYLDDQLLVEYSKRTLGNGLTAVTLKRFAPEYELNTLIAPNP